MKKLKPIYLQKRKDYLNLNYLHFKIYGLKILKQP